MVLLLLCVCDGRGERIRIRRRTTPNRPCKELPRYPGSSHPVRDDNVCFSCDDDDYYFLTSFLKSHLFREKRESEELRHLCSVMLDKTHDKSFDVFPSTSFLKSQRNGIFCQFLSKKITKK